MQSEREAVESLIRRRRADHVPLFDNPWGETVTRWTQEGMPRDAHGNPVDVTAHFGFGMAGCGGWFDWQPRRGFSETIEESADWRIVRNGAGALLKWWKNKSGTPEHIGFHMTTRDVWDKEYRPLVAGPFDRQRLGDVGAQGRELKRRRDEGRWGFFGNLGMWECMRASMGDYAMLMAVVDDPAWIHDFNRVYTDLYKQAFDILFREAGKPDGVWIYDDLGYKERLYCSPASFADLLFPYYTELVEFFHSYDVPVVLHTCGFQEPALPLIVQAGFDGLNPMEVKAGNDIFKFAELYGDRLMFVGGLDARILESGDRAAIRAGVADFMTGLKARGARFLFGSDHSVSNRVSYADFLYALDVYREHMNL